jgi:ribonuclease P/MRP protein subunit POP1
LLIPSLIDFDHMRHRYESGARMGKTMLHHYKQWPLGMIGPAEILWQSSSIPTARKQVWVRFHPAMFPEAWEAIRSSVSGWYEQGSSTTQGKGEPGTIVMKDLRGDICAFELMGPRSASVLRGVMGLVKDQTLRSDTSAVEPDLDAMAVDDDEILEGEQEDDPDEVSKSAKKRFWTGMKHVQSSGQLSEGMVVGLRVHDPRLRSVPVAISACTLGSYWLTWSMEQISTTKCSTGSSTWRRSITA